MPLASTHFNQAKNIPENFSKSFMYSIHQMYFLVQKHLEQALAKDKTLSFSQFMILVGCQCSSLSTKTVSQIAIAERLYLTEATVSRHISILVKLGYILRDSDTKNRRKHVITITPLGLKRFKAAESIITKELETIFSVIKSNDRNSIIKNLEKVLSQLLTKK